MTSTNIISQIRGNARRNRKTGQKGIELIKSFEGLRLKAYKAIPSEPYYTIGYGHYGKDVSPDAVIDEDEAIYLLKRDLEKAERAVNDLKIANSLNQYQFDALVSFTYNCGSGNLKKLVKDRSIEDIGKAILKYNKANGQVLQGLVRRRQAEHDLYFMVNVDR